LSRLCQDSLATVEHGRDLLSGNNCLRRETAKSTETEVTGKVTTRHLKHDSVFGNNLCRLSVDYFVKVNSHCVLALTSVAITATVMCGCHSVSHSSSKDAELEVYETVVRYKVATEGPIYFMFGDTMFSKPAPPSNTKWCQESTRMSLEENVLPHISLRPDTIQDFITKSCVTHTLSEPFRADLRKTFAETGRKHGAASNEPGTAPPSAGFLSFSRVGFDSTLDEAVVETSFVCGGLCGHGDRYVLRKRQGYWEVVIAEMTWIS